MSAPPDSFIRFEPIYQTRVWGGRLLAERFGRDLPDLELPFGESWEISAREEADSRILGGSLDGRRLTELWADPGLRRALFGESAPDADRFPLLFKILDARDTLSIQVHPPASVAAALGGEPKTEVWYIADAAAGAMLYVGVKEGIDEARFREALASGEAESCVHSVPVSKGQHLAIPSGRLHAIGAGLLIYEIQQNSDTTYRVFDWNRKDSKGNPRDLHIEESLACIDFKDTKAEIETPIDKTLVSCPYFTTTLHRLSTGETIGNPNPDQFSLITVVSGSLDHIYAIGQTILLPKSSEPLTASELTTVLQITIPS